MHRATTSNCKILLSKFNTCGQVHSERKKGSLTFFDNHVKGFSTKNFSHYTVTATPFKLIGNAEKPLKL